MWTQDQINAEVDYRRARLLAAADVNRQLRTARLARAEADASAARVASKRESAVRRDATVRA